MASMFVACGGGETGPTMSAGAGGSWGSTYTYRVSPAESATASLLIIEDKYGEFSGTVRLDTPPLNIPGVPEPGPYVALNLGGLRNGTSVQIYSTCGNAFCFVFDGTLAGGTMTGKISGNRATYDGSPAAITLTRQ
jgi:hypothetical protein